jgi:hypothetical protein
MVAIFFIDDEFKRPTFIFSRNRDSGLQHEAYNQNRQYSSAQNYNISLLKHDQQLKHQTGPITSTALKV